MYFDKFSPDDIEFLNFLRPIMATFYKRGFHKINEAWDNSREITLETSLDKCSLILSQIDNLMQSRFDDKRINGLISKKQSSMFSPGSSIDLETGELKIVETKTFMDILAILHEFTHEEVKDCRSKYASYLRNLRLTVGKEVEDPDEYEKRIKEGIESFKAGKNEPIIGDINLENTENILNETCPHIMELVVDNNFLDFKGNSLSRCFRHFKKIPAVYVMGLSAKHGKSDIGDFIPEELKELYQNGDEYIMNNQLIFDPITSSRYIISVLLAFPLADRIINNKDSINRIFSVFNNRDTSHLEKMIKLGLSGNEIIEAVSKYAKIQKAKVKETKELLNK